MVVQASYHNILEAEVVATLDYTVEILAQNNNNNNKKLLTGEEGASRFWTGSA